MGKFFAVTIIVIAILSAIPIVRHTWWMAPDISTHGAPIDEQMSETMAEAGISFLASQILLAVFMGGLMVGRTPEYLKQRLHARHMKLVGLYILALPIAVLVGTAVAMAMPG